MSRKEHIFATTLRIDTDTQEGKQAVRWLKSRDKKEFPSYSDLITEAVNAYCSHRHALENDPYLETRQKEDAFLRQIEERVEQAIRQAEARGFANAIQMMQAGFSPVAAMPANDMRAPQHDTPKQPDSAESMEMDEESLDIAMSFIGSL